MEEQREVLDRHHKHIWVFLLTKYYYLKGFYKGF